jgi:cephalosporin hydroxylase
VVGEEWPEYGKLLFAAPEPDDAGAKGAEAPRQEAVGFFAVAYRSHLALPEFAAFNYGKELPWMRRWELPFAIFQSRLTDTMAVLDCSINPTDLGRWIGELYPHVLYRRANPLADGQYLMPPAAPDESFDRVFCLNTIEYFTRPQREQLMSIMAAKLKPGGWLVMTVNSYFESSWNKREWLDKGLMRADRQEVVNGCNRVPPAELADLCERNGLQPLSSVPLEPREGDRGLYLNPSPLEHAIVGAVFSKGPVREPAHSTVLLALLTWNTAGPSLESLNAHVREANILRRLGHNARICVVDNGSSDGTAEALRKIEGKLDVPHRLILNPENMGNSRARNQVIDHMLESGADYLLFVDGDIELVPFSTFVMLRYMESCGSRLGCFGAYAFSFTSERAQATPALPSLANCAVHASDNLSGTGYAMFRRQVFEDGVRLDESGPFGGPGWGLEDNDLAFQMGQRGYLNHYFTGIRYLHRNLSSSVGILSAQGMEPTERYYQRKEYVIRKWKGVPGVSQDAVNSLHHARPPWREIRTGKMASVRCGASTPEIPVPGEVLEWVDWAVSVMLDRTELIALAAMLVSFDWQLSDLVVEIGAYLGTTTVFMAKVLEVMGSRATVLSIDPFERCQPDNLNPQGIYAEYIKNIHSSGVEDRCLALAAFSAQAAPVVPSRVGILVIDGSHHYDAVKADLDLYIPKVVQGGYIFIDDYGSAYPDVVRAVDEYLVAHPDLEVVVKSYYVILKRP